MSALLYRLGHFCVRHHRAVLAVWAVIFIGLIALTAVIGKPTNSNVTLPGTGSTEATNLLDRQAAEGAERDRADRPRREVGQARHGRQREGGRRRRSSPPAEPGSHQGRQPALEQGHGRALEGQDDRLHLGHPQRRARRPEPIDEAEASFDAAEPGPTPGSRSRPAAISASRSRSRRRESSEVDRHRRGDHHPPVHVRDRGGDGDADRDRDPRSVIGLCADRPARPRDRRSRPSRRRSGR